MQELAILWRDARRELAGEAPSKYPGALSHRTLDHRATSSFGGYKGGKWMSAYLRWLIFLPDLAIRVKSYLDWQKKLRG